MNTRNKVSFLVYNAMFSTISLILAFLGNLTLFPVFPFLKADLSDMPIYLAAFTSPYGIYSGITSLLTVSIIRAIFFSTSGFIGVIMRLPPIIVIIAIGISKNKNLINKTISIFSGFTLSIICKIILNYFFWINFFSIPENTINALLFIIILPYNIIKTGLSLFLAFVINKRLDKYINLERNKL